MYFSLIIATLGKRYDEFRRLLDSLSNQTFKEFEVIVVSQGNYDLVDSMLKQTSLNYTHIFSEKRGLSVARNKGLKYVKGDFITISDDDCWYPPNALEKIERTICLYKEYDAFTFQIFDPISNIPYKKYRKAVTLLNRLTICKVSSIEVYFSRRILDSGFEFDESFGLGAKYVSGEENIFLNEVLKNGYSVCYVPISVVYHRKYRNNNCLNNIQMTSKYYLFMKMYSYIGVLFYYAFYVKHFRKVDNKVKSLFPFLS